MSVQFEEETLAHLQNATFSNKPKGLSGKLISWGVAKDQNSANMILVITLVVVLIFTGFVIFGGGGSGNPTPGDIAPGQFIP